MIRHVSRLRTPRLPPHAPGMAIGLYGGSFNPPHAAHRMVAETALERLGLDRVWVLVTPGNPLKDNSALPPAGERMAATRELFADPRIVVTDVEREIGAARSYEIVKHLAARAPGVRFVWIMGADNLASLHGWGRWRALGDLVPIAVVDRPGATFSPLSSRAAAVLGRFRVDERDAAGLPGMRAPAWTFLHGRRLALSSTALRGGGASDRSFPPGFRRKG